MAIQGIDLKLESISTDVQKLSATTEHLSALYSSLNNQMLMYEAKQEERWKEMDQRLANLEEEQQKETKQQQLADLRGDFTQIVKEQVELSIKETLALSSNKTENDLAENMNRALVTLDMAERKSRKLIWVITGLDGDKGTLERGVRKLFADKFNIQDEITNINVADHSSRVTVSISNWKAKLNILKKKRETLTGSNVYINNDLTQREQKIDAKLRGVLKRKKTERCFKEEKS